MLVARRADDIGVGTLVAAVKDAAELITRLQEGVGLVDQQRRLPLFNCAEERRRRDIGGGTRARHEGAQQSQTSGLATFRSWAGYAKHRANVEAIMCMCVNGPEGYCLGGAVRQD